MTGLVSLHGAQRCRRNRSTTAASTHTESPTVCISWMAPSHLAGWARTIISSWRAISHCNVGRLEYVPCWLLSGVPFTGSGESGAKVTFEGVMQYSECVSELLCPAIWSSSNPWGSGLLDGSGEWAFRKSWAT